MNTLSYLFFLLLPLQLVASGDIVVRLATESKLLPIYVTDIKESQSAYSSDYLKQLEGVLRFDLHHNGATQLAENNPEREAKAWGGTLDPTTDRIYYAVTLQMESDKLVARIASLSGKTVQRIGPLSLAGDLSVDRRVMHQLADKIHELLFHKPGIALSKILYTVRQKSGNRSGQEWLSEVWEADWDGANVRQVTFDGSYSVMPTYLPPKPGYSAGSFFYVSYKSGQPKIFVAPLQASERPQRLISLRGNQLMPAVAATRGAVAFINDVTGNPDLFLQRFDPDVGTLGKPYQIFSAVRGTQASPTFSPDGRRVAFVSNKDGSPRIYVMSVPEPGTRLKAIHPQLITLANRESTAPAWSPDGAKIAYCAKNSGGTRQIWIYDVHTGKEKQITSGPGNKENPSWAPNSLHLVFNSADNRASELYLINLNQTSAVQITKGRGEKRFPDWEPR